MAAVNAKKMCGMVEVFTDDNKNMTVNNTMSSGTQVPQEVAYEKGKKFTDLKDMFPCFYVLGGSNGAVMLVGSHEHRHHFRHSISHAIRLNNTTLLSS